MALGHGFAGEQMILAQHFAALPSPDCPGSRLLPTQEGRERQCFLQRTPARSRCRRQTVRRSVAARLVFARDLFHQIDDSAPKLGLLDSGECLSECQSFGGRQEVPQIGWGGRIFRRLGLNVRVWGTFEKERYWDLQYLGDLLNS